MGVAQLEVVEGDLTAQAVDAVVNAANSTLLGGGGVDGAIHRAAGPRLLEECRRIRRTTWPDGLPVGRAVATGAGDLAARWVIHTVGPDLHRGQDDPALLASCFTSCLDVAAELGAISVAFPAISAGAYGWAARDVARIAISSSRAWAERAADASVDVVRFVLFGPQVAAAFQAALALPAISAPDVPEIG